MRSNLKGAVLRGRYRIGIGRRFWLRCKNLVLDRRDAQILRGVRTSAPSVRDRQQELVRFYSHYEELVGILVDLAQTGPTLALEAKYRSIREWMEKNYPSVQRHVIAYLRYSANDAQQSLEMMGTSADAFEALFIAPSLMIFLAHDDGRMIDRIARTREALSLYGHHLRCLASNE